jgi:ABC-2 type transport system ATP-binding protein
MIEFVHVSKRFRNKKAVEDISFEARKGEIIGFLGPNGAGKTTTMRLLLGYLSPSEGTVTVDKKPPSENRIALLKQVGYLPENNPLYPEMKVREYLSFVAGLRGVSDWDELPEQVGLDDVMESRIEELSRGYRQRVGLAAALLPDPPILILDEPTSGLDPIEQDRIKDLIRSIAKNKTIIFSTHILSEVEDIANRLIIIKKGSLVYDGAKPAGKGSVEKLFKKLVKGEN